MPMQGWPEQGHTGEPDACLMCDGRGYSRRLKDGGKYFREKCRPCDGTGLRYQPPGDLRDRRFQRGLAHWANAREDMDGNRVPWRGGFRSVWARGYAEYGPERVCRPPYRHSSNHGGTWGVQLHKAYRGGWEQAAREGGEAPSPQTPS